jgi:hypothetical protein
METKIHDVHVAVLSGTSDTGSEHNNSGTHNASSTAASETRSLPPFSKASGSDIDDAAVYLDKHSVTPQTVIDLDLDPKRLRKLQWKIDLHILPFLLFGLMLNFLDKVLYNVCDSPLERRWV